jgi:hypothetical protein
VTACALSGAPAMFFCFTTGPKLLSSSIMD